MRCEDGNQMQDRADWLNRVNRREYWIKTIFCLASIYAVLWVAVLLLEVVHDNKAMAIAICHVSFGCCLAIVLYWLFDALCRRLHDCGGSGWWIVGFVVIDGMMRSCVLNCPWSRIPWEAWTLIAIALPVVAGLWPGTPDRNKYGSVPPKRSFMEVLAMPIIQRWMPAMKRIALLPASLSIFVLLLVTLSCEFVSLDGIAGVVCPVFFPENTLYSEQWNYWAYRFVRNGMSVEEVTEKLGPPIKQWSYDIGNGKIETRFAYTISPSDSHYRIRQIVFRDGEVVGKFHEYYVD